LPTIKGYYGYGTTEAEVLTDFKEIFFDWIFFALNKNKVFRFFKIFNAY